MTSSVSETNVATRVAPGELGERTDRPREPSDGASRTGEPSVDRAQAQPDSNAAEIAASEIERAPKVAVDEGREIEFSFDHDSNRIVVRVTSHDGDRVIRQIPPEQYLRFRDRLSEMVGVLFDERS
jgi:uncharacterized FlaG/YvyC family protein